MEEKLSEQKKSLRKWIEEEVLNDDAYGFLAFCKKTESLSEESIITRQRFEELYYEEYKLHRSDY